MTSVLYDAPGPKARLRSRLIAVLALVVIAAVLVWVILSMQQRGIFDERWKVFYDPSKGQSAADVWTSLLVRGLGATLIAAVIAAPIALLLGVGAVMLRTSTNRVISVLANAVIEFFRGLPVVLVMLFVLLAFGVPALWAVVAGLVIYNTAIFAEILRAGVVALPKGQREAGLAVGMSPFQTFRMIQLPQAVRSMLPSLISQLVVLLKDSSLGFIVGYVELLRVINQNVNFFGPDYLFPLFFVGAAIYIAINMALSRVATWLERRGTSKKVAKPKKGGEGTIGPPVEVLDSTARGGLR